jgi:hypothetical protein
LNKIGIITTIIALWIKHLNNYLHQIVPVVITTSDRFVTGNGLYSGGNSNTGEGLEKYGSARIAGFSQSMKLIKNILLPLFNKHKPKKILTENGKQFKESWEKFLKRQGIEPLFAHPYYPQDKGKVERTIRNVAEEFVNLLKKFPQWLGGQIKKYKIWYNEERLHRGIGIQPAKISMGKCNVG